MRRVVSFLRVDDDHPLNGWHVLGIVFVFFGTIITVNVVMAAYATGTFPGLVVKNSYVASQHYNELLAESRAQAERGWSADVSEEGGLLRVRFTDPSGAPLSGLKVQARAGRPATSTEDHAVALRSTSDGYVADEPLSPGRWIIELDASSADALVFRSTHPLLVGGGGS